MKIVLNNEIYYLSDDESSNGTSKDLATLKTVAFYNTMNNWNGNTWNINVPSNSWRIYDGETLPFFCWQINDCEGSLSVPGTETTKISVYPNPTTGELRIENGEWRIEGIEIYDVYGRKCHVSRVTRHENEIDISNLQPGIYFVKVITKQGEIVRKILKK